MEKLETIHKAEAGARTQRLATAAALVLLPLIYFLPAVLGKIALVPGDGLTQNLGVRVLVGQMIANGHLPLWNPYIFAGMPLLASIYPGALYPPNWLFAIFSATTAINIVVITTYHLTIIGSYLYGRRIGMTRAGALIAGTAFTFGGYMMAHMGHTSRIAAAAWLPWILLAIEHLYVRATWRWVALGAVFIALQFCAGEPQMSFYTVLVCGAYGLFSLIGRERQERRIRFLLAAVAMAVCGLLLSMIQLLPERELLGLGERAGINYEYFSGYSFPPGHVLTFIFPFFFGGAMIAPYTIGYWGQSTIDEACGYVGLLTLLLAMLALFAQRLLPERRAIVWFWAAVALVSFVLALGGYLPFGLNHVLHHTPVYNLFRAPARHLYEFTFSLAMLAGLGASFIAQVEREKLKSGLRRSSIVFVAVVAVAAIVYRFFGNYLAAEVPRPAGGESLANPELLMPLVCAALSLIAFWVFARRRNAVSAALLMVVLFADLASFSLAFNWGWRGFLGGVSARLQDPPAVQFIKSREPDLNSFRIVSYAPRPFGGNYDELDFPNVSVARGLQSVNGYDALRLLRTTAIAGDMGSDGIIGTASVFDATHQGLNLLNVKYLLHERVRPDHPEFTTEIEGVRFDNDLLSLDMAKGSHEEAVVGEAQATELLVVSTMAFAVHIPDETPVVRIKLHTADGRVIERELRVGRDTAEWAYEREEVRAEIKHRRPTVAESLPSDGFPANRYLARFPFDRAVIERIEFDYLLPDAALVILRASFFDAATGLSTLLSPIDFQAERWRKLAQFGEVEVYENKRLLPRAWFVRRAAVEFSEDVPQTIKTGKMKDGSAFDPAETVLFEKEDFGNREVTLPQIGEPTNAEAKVTRYEPQRIELQTRNAQPGLLVLSEIYYRGWEAWIDGRRAPVEKVNYTLRGLSLPAGEHRIEFVFRAHSFRNGAAYTLLGVLLLLAFAGGGRFGGGRILSRIESGLEGLAARASNEVGSGLRRSVERVLATVESVLSALSKSRFVLIAAVIGLTIYGYVLVRHASYAVGGSDSSGYGNIAQSLLRGSIVQPVAGLDELGLPDNFARIFIPLGYDPRLRPGTMSPAYPIGLPLHMAAGALIAGWDYGPFLVSPAAAVLSLILIYLVGLELGLPRGFSIAGAVMLAASPTFIFMALAPMSDVTATCWSLVAIWASLRTSRREGKKDGWALLAGAAFGMAVLVRPSSILLLVPILFSLHLRPRTILFFLLGGLPLAAVFFAFNAIAYGRPLQTGYGSTAYFDLMTTDGFTARFKFYVYWLAMTMSPLLLLGWLGAAADRRVYWRVRALLVAWFGVFLLFYSCYDIYDDWWYTRFLLPAYPAMILGALLIARDVAGLFEGPISERNRARLSWVVLAILLAAVLGFARHYIKRFDVFSVGEGESVHSVSSRWADRMIPSQALVVSMEQSGALKFYTRRPILRWDWVTPDQWQLLKTRAAERGYEWYALLQPQEVEDAQKRLPGKWVQIGKLRHMSLWRIETTSGSP